MTTLGIDPGQANVGWAVLRDGKHLTSGYFRVAPKTPWPAALKLFLPQLQHLVTCYCPDLVAVEKAQMSGRTDNGKSAQAVFSMAVATQRTEELAGKVLEMAARAGAETARVHPRTGLRALGLPHGATDGQVAKMFTVITGEKLKATEAHQARALGVALVAEREARLLERALPL